MNWRQIVFRIVGVACIGAGVYAFYGFGKDILPHFTLFLAGKPDVFGIFTVLSSFLCGAFSLVVVGVYFLLLRSFSSTWLWFAIIPLAVWLQRMYDIERIWTLDRVFSLWLVYIGIYLILVHISLFMHTYWFMPISHENGRHVGLEKAEKPLLFELRWAILLAGLTIFIIFNPSESLHIFNQCVSGIVYALKWIQS